MEHYQTLNRKLKWGLVWGLFLSASLVHAGPTPAPTPPKLIPMLERGSDNGRMHLGEENRGVVYLKTDAERAPYVLHYDRDKKIFRNAHQEPMHTLGAVFTENGDYIDYDRALFVALWNPEEKKLQILAANQKVVGKFHHSSLAAGQPVVAAGTLKFENGKLIEIGNHSGHYHPDFDSVVYMIQYFESLGVDCSDVIVTLEPASVTPLLESAEKANLLVKYSPLSILRTADPLLPHTESRAHDILWNQIQQDLKEGGTKSNTLKKLIQPVDAGWGRPGMKRVMNRLIQNDVGLLPEIEIKKLTWIFSHDELENLLFSQFLLHLPILNDASRSADERDQAFKVVQQIKNHAQDYSSTSNMKERLEHLSDEILADKKWIYPYLGSKPGSTALEIQNLEAFDAMVIARAQYLEKSETDKTETGWLKKWWCKFTLKKGKLPPQP